MLDITNMKKYNKTFIKIVIGVPISVPEQMHSGIRWTQYGYIINAGKHI